MEIRRRAAAALLLAGLGAAAGCAGLRGAPGAASPHELLSERPTTITRNCAVTRVPLELPGADVLVDSATLSAALRDALVGPARGYALLSIGFDRNGYNVRRAVVEHDLSPARADTLQKLVFAHRREVEPGDPWGVRLRIDVDADRVAMRVGRQLWCDARPLRAVDALGTTDAMDAWSVTRRAPAPTAANSSVILDLHVNEIGRVTETRVVGGYMTTRQEHYILALLTDLNFSPATADGVPVSAWTRMHMRLPAL
jgi:hypothetical protein